uniref:CARD domain-containing protein n=1 Tax=Plectus sambesii TaxID=2011161 RepID=A0A914X090_9BILA
MGNFCSGSSKENDDNCSSDQISDRTKNNGLKAVQTSPADEQFLNGNREEVDNFTKNLFDLCNALNPKEVLVYLEGENVITSVEAEEIRAEKTRFDTNRKLIKVVMERGPDASRCFSTALEETAQHHLAEKLRTTHRKIDNISSSFQM